MYHVDFVDLGDYFRKMCIFLAFYLVMSKKSCTFAAIFEMGTRTLTICNASAGSGKTFTLAAYYVACLMESKDMAPYRSVLAVTFTNKATAEMKDRILTHLYALGEGHGDVGFLGKVQKILGDWGCEMSEAAICAKAKGLFREMLAHYDDVKVTTIDSFLQLLLAGLAQSLGLAANFSIELDTKNLLQIAVDQILSTHIDEEAGLSEAIQARIEQLLKEDKKLNEIRASLKELAEELLKESVQIKTTDADFDREHIADFREAVSLDSNPQMQKLRKKWEELQPRRVEICETIKGHKYYNKWLRFVEAMLRGKKVKMEDSLSTSGVTYLEDLTEQPKELYEKLRDLNNLYESLKKDYLRWYYTTEHLGDMMLLTYIRNRMRGNLHEANSVLLAETAHKLSEALKPGDADFILEKAGIRFKHILLDEFQDTSTLQWNNFRRLIEEVLASGGTTLIVGDTKQSIYRFRNGDRSIMEGMKPGVGEFGAYIWEEPLRRNFRSRREIVEFNLNLFKRIQEAYSLSLYNEEYTGDNIGEYYVTDKHEGGYVRFRAYVKDNSTGAGARARVRCVRDMFEQIEELLRQGVEAKDCLILLRGNKSADAKMVLPVFREMQQDAATYPYLSKAEIVSADSFDLDGSRSVNVAVNGLKYVVRRDRVAQAFVRFSCPGAEIEKLDAIRPNLPLTEMLEEVIRICLCPDSRFVGDDILYLDNLQDEVRTYVGKYGANAEAFLTYWDDSLHAKKIGAVESNAIRLMTIHKAKGLEAKNVFIPFCNWTMESSKEHIMWFEPAVQPADEDKQLTQVPLSFSKNLLEADYKDDYVKERAEEHIDNLNLLYVSLTRAADRLFISTYMAQPTDKPLEMNDVGALLLRYCDLEEPFVGCVDYAELERGELFPKPSAKEPESEPTSLPQPFSFAKVSVQHAEYHLDPVGVEFRQSQDSFQYTLFGAAQGQQNLDKRAFGNICHDILAQAEKQGDVTTIIGRFVRQGIIRDEALRKQVEETLARAWEHKEMCDWFSGEYTLLREETILLPERLRKLFTEEEHALDEVTEQRPDRVMTKGNKAVVLDYKFGAMHDYYFAQVRRYMLLMRELGYTEVTGYIWAAEDNELILVEP